MISFKRFLSAVISICISTGVSLSMSNGNDDNTPYMRAPWMDHQTFLNDLENEEKLYCGHSDNDGEPFMYSKRPSNSPFLSEYRLIMAFNMPHLISHNGFMHSLQIALKEALEVLAANKDEAYKYQGDRYGLSKFIYEVSRKIDNRSEIINLSRFFGESRSIIAQSLLYSLIAIRVDPGFSKIGLTWDAVNAIITILGIAVGIGTVVKGTQGLATICANPDNLKRVSKSACRHIVKGAKGAVHAAGQELLRNPGIFAPKGVKLISAGGNFCHAHLAAGELAGQIGVGLRVGGGALAGGPAFIFLEKIVESVSKTGMEYQFEQQKICNYSYLFWEFIDILHGNRQSLLDNNLVVIAIDRREFSTWLPWNRVRENQFSGVWITTDPKLNKSPKGRDYRCGAVAREAENIDAMISIKKKETNELTTYFTNRDENGKSIDEEIMDSCTIF